MLTRCAISAPLQDATLRSADVSKGAWRVRILYALTLLPEAPPVVMPA